MLRDVVLPYRALMGADDPELRYALRSLDFIPDLSGKVYFVGDMPDWVQDCIHIEAPSQNKWRELHDVWYWIGESDFLTDEIIYTEGDYFLLEPVAVELPNYYKTSYQHRMTLLDRSGARGGWSNSLRDTNELLLKMGVERPLSFDMHIPMIIERNLIDPTVATEKPLRWRSIIGNLSDRTPTPLALDVKCINEEEFRNVLAAGIPFLSSNESTFRASGVQPHLERVHPVKCRYEK